MGNYHKRSTLLSASHIIYEKYPISKLQSHLEMDRPEIGLQFSLLSLPRSPIKGFLSGCKARLVHTPPPHPASASFETSPGQLDSQQILDLSRKFSTPFDAIGLVSYFSLALTHACPHVWVGVPHLRANQRGQIRIYAHAGSVKTPNSP